MTSQPSLLSGRAQERLAQLQRSLLVEYRALNNKQSLLSGALQACDVSTQSAMLTEYLDSIETLLAVLIRLRTFAARHTTMQPENEA